MENKIIDLRKVKHLRIAKEMGFRDWHEGKKLSDNPYKLSDLATAYEEGMQEAELEHNNLPFAS